MQGQIDTTFGTYQRDMFESGLVAEIGANAFAVWCAIKSHSDFATGVCYPGIRRLMVLTRLASATVQKAIAKLEMSHLLRSFRKGQRRYYVARERLDVRLGDRTLCTIVVDYVPNSLRDRLARIKAALQAGTTNSAAFADVDIIPGSGFTWDAKAGVLRASIPIRNIPRQIVMTADRYTTPLGTQARQLATAAIDRRSTKIAKNAQKTGTVSAGDTA